ncbi:hypothetical protein LUZ63_013645 [Rhynchospora breviuscula]|uniref:Malectin-like domain-containing protein n=1 Tax=Rhynchospora breviuscula TaxID=2022672 RepID=A0A9Q0HL50_9POAL|nr:hypothetical protein LUZ63_013645 [Rhynchospora breviuscula]
MMLTSWTSISTTSTLEGYAFEVPSLVLQTAATPLSANGSIDLNWTAPDTSIVFFVVLHFAEIQILQTNSLREFCIYANGELFFKDPVPASYGISRGWNGDPCVPPSLQWAGVNCSIDSTNIPKITALDLSYNNLSGNIPGSLDQLVSLTYL